MGLWRDMAKKEWPDGQMTWKTDGQMTWKKIYRRQAMNQHHIMLELPIVSQGG